MRIINKALDFLEESVLVVSIAIMVALNFINVVCRTLLPGISFSYTEEITVILFVWTAMFGISYAYRLKAHTALSFVTDKLPAPVRKLVLVFAALCTVVFAVAVIATGVSMVANQIRFNQVTSGLRIPQALSGAAMPVGGILIVIRGLQEGYSALREGEKKA